MNLYRYSPIHDVATIHKALNHIYTELIGLRNDHTSAKWSVSSLKLFAHYDSEYKFLCEWISTVGPKDSISSKTSFYVRPSSPFMVDGQEIENLGIRVPDPYRSQVGCGDFEVKDYGEAKHRYIRDLGLREVDHPKYEMLELFNPDIDVLGYIVKK